MLTQCYMKQWHYQGNRVMRSLCSRVYPRIAMFGLPNMIKLSTISLKIDPLHSIFSLYVLDNAFEILLFLQLLSQWPNEIYRIHGKIVVATLAVQMAWCTYWRLIHSVVDSIFLTKAVCICLPKRSVQGTEDRVFSNRVPHPRVWLQILLFIFFRLPWMWRQGKWYDCHTPIWP